MAASGHKSAVACGQRAEDLAAAYLQACGYRLVERNFRCPQGEIDIVAYTEQTLCFVEVRARATDQHGHPLETIGATKRRRIARAAAHWLQRFVGPWPPMRFDALGILLQQPPLYTLVQDAFEIA